MSSQSQSSILWQWLKYSELTRDQAVALFELRQNVFIVEQNCPFPDIDGLDPQATHLLAWEGSQLVAYLRLFDQFAPYQGRASIGRICTHPEHRGGGLGRELVMRGLQQIDDTLAAPETEIGAQLYLQKFYQSFGFVPCSDVYIEDGIDHIHMLRKRP
ncbi:MAG: GNAT family N-acetyltransferase [Gammaproteobacteria bacterium]|nr:GNAT family N-acetyltransferase [Gammaproteobacteria bacterium]NVK89289.1 GNAT family N-acetyltransferase [Gammaproteobacteria bacterium]